jgi:hypothetical protein
MSILEKPMGEQIEDQRDQKSTGIFVYRFDYQINGNPWQAFIAAYTPVEAADYLNNLVGNCVITSSGQECRLDAVSDPLRKTIINKSKKKPGRPKKVK